MNRYDRTDFEWSVMEPLLLNNPRGLHTVLNPLLENCSAWERRQPGHPGPIRFPGKSASA